MKKILALYAVLVMPVVAIAQLNCTISTFNNPTCSVNCNGSATVTASGGVAPYTFLWMPGNITTATISNMCAGSYTCTVTDQNSTVCSSTITLVNPPTLIASASSTPESICNACDGSISVSATGGVAPYSYCWGPSCAVCTAANCPFICAGTYTIVVTDANGCTANAVTTVTSPPSISGSLSGPTSICGPANNGVITLTGQVGSVIRWEMSTDGGLTWVNIANTTTSHSFSNLTVTTMFRVLVQNATCPAAYSSTITVAVTSSPTVTTSEIPANCNGTGEVDATATAGQPPYVYQWTPGNFMSPNYPGVTPNITYTCTVTDANGCTTAAMQLLTDSCDYVWPGDANDDAVADNVDILDIGIANGATGTTRANASLTWIGQPSAPWGQSLASGTDYKWVDCDGNGAINPIDTQAVVLNYGMIHNNRNSAPENSLTAPSVAVSFDQDSVESGTTGTISLSLGDAANPATNVYGLAFRLNYDAAQMNTSSFGMTGGSTWFGTTGTDMMRVVLHPSPSNGYVDVAITRYDQQNVSGFGMLGQFYYTATTTLNGTGNSVVVPMNITNVVLVDNAGTSQAVNVVNDSVVVADTAVITGVAQHSSAAFEVYPNPANENIIVNISGSEQQLVTIEDLSGRVVYSEKHAAGLNTISVSELPAGTYLLHIGAGENSLVERITIAH